MHGAHPLIDQRAGVVRGLHGGDRRGRWLLGHRSTDRRIYLIETAEKGIAWLRLRAHGYRRARVDAQRRQRGDGDR